MAGRAQFDDLGEGTTSSFLIKRAFPSRRSAGKLAKNGRAAGRERRGRSAKARVYVRANYIREERKKCTRGVHGVAYKNAAALCGRRRGALGSSLGSRDRVLTGEGRITARPDHRAILQRTSRQPN